jgi:hypothetical protein
LFTPTEVWKEERRETLSQLANLALPNDLNGT